MRIKLALKPGEFSYDGHDIYNSACVFLEEAEAETKKILAMLKEDAKRVMPRKLFRKVAYFSLDTLERRVFIWRYGTDEWMSEDGSSEVYCECGNRIDY